MKREISEFYKTVATNGNTYSMAGDFKYVWEISGVLSVSISIVMLLWPVDNLDLDPLHLQLCIVNFHFKSHSTKD